MEQIILEYTRRTPKGTAAASRLRGEGRVPGILYGHKLDPVPLSVDKEALESFLQHGYRTLTLQDGPQSEMALLKALQYDAMGDDLIHADFARVAEDERVQVAVPILLHGTPKGAAEGGVLDHVARELHIECRVVAIPESIRIDVDDLEIEQSLHISDLVTDPDIKILDDPEGVVVVLHPPRVVEVEETEEAELEDLSAEPEIIGRKPEEEDEEEPEEGAKDSN